MAKTKETVSKDDAFTLTKAQVADLAQFFAGHFIKNFDDLKEQLAQTQEIRIIGGAQPVTIRLSVEDLWQIQQQSIGMGQSFEQYVHDFCEDAISMYLNGNTVIRY